MRHLRGIQSTCACQGVGFDQRLILSTRAFFREDFKVMMRILWESSTGMLSWIFCAFQWESGYYKMGRGVRAQFHIDESVFCISASLVRSYHVFCYKNIFTIV